LQNIDVFQLLIYPPGRGGISISTIDYACLASDIYLNDVIIDFYLKYIECELLSPEQREKTHIFSQFFYKRLATKTNDNNPNLSPDLNRHNRVASWTKNVNLFEKDFIIVPINERSHWFLAIICFPNLTEPRAMDDDKPVNLIPVQKRMSDTMRKRKETINLGDEVGDVRDEAESDESDHGNYYESDEEMKVIAVRRPVKL
jgi:sentrin-specific protease 7